MPATAPGTGNHAWPAMEKIGFGGLPPEACAVMRRANLVKDAVQFHRGEQRDRVQLQKVGLNQKELLDLLGCRCFVRIESMSGGFQLIFADSRSQEERFRDDANALKEAGDEKGAAVSRRDRASSIEHPAS